MVARDLVRFWVLLILVGGTLHATAPDNDPDDPNPDQTQETTFVDETVVTAPYRAGSDTPVTYTDLDREEIDRKHFGQEPSMVLAATPSMTSYIDSGGIAGYSYFRLRGIDQTRVNMTLDGVPLNEPEDQGVYFSNYPDFLSSVRSMQIQRGVGTSSNGVASYAGSVMFETPDVLAPAAFSASLGSGSFGSRRLSAELTTDIGDDAGLYLRASHLSSDGYRHHSGNESSSLFYSFGWASGRHLLKLTGFVGRQKNSLAWLGVPLDELEHDDRANGNTAEEQDQFTQALTMLQHSTAVSADTTLSLCLYANHLQGDYDFDYDSFLGLGPGSELYNYDLRANLIGAFANLSHHGSRFELHGGVHGNRYRRRHLGSERSAGQLYQNTGFKHEVSAFAKTGVKLGGWLLFGDLQLRYTSFDYHGSVEIEAQSWSFINPRLGISRRLADGVVAYYSIGRTGREPTRNDLFGGSDDLGADDNGAPLLLDIPPEQVVDHELGVRAHGSGWQAQANLYWMRFDDEITLSGQFGPNGLPLHSNVARSARTGLEVEARVALGGGLSLSNSSAFADNRVKEGGVSFAPVLSPEVIINQELLLERGALRVSLCGRYQARAWIDLANSVELPSYTVLDGALSYQWQRLRLDLHAVNLLDRRPLTFGSIRADGVPVYFVHPPRSLFVAVTWSR